MLLLQRLFLFELLTAKSRGSPVARIGAVLRAGRVSIVAVAVGMAIPVGVAVAIGSQVV